MRILLCVLVFSCLPRINTSAQLPPVQSAIAQVSLDSLTLFVKQLSGESPVIIGGVQDTIVSRLSTHPGNEKAFRFLREKMTAYGLSVDSVVVGPRKSLIATLPGNTTNAYMIGAHYDCVGLLGQPFAGADDNASGCAAVIEAARILSTMPTMPATVRFAFWDEEEQGMLGSRDYTSTGLNFILHRGYINLDMIGYDGNGDNLIELYTAPIAASQSFASLAQTMPALYGINLQIERLDPGPNNTDYASFWDFNATAIGLAEDLDGDPNPKYHQAGDSLSQFNLPYFRKLSQLAIALLTHSAITDAASIPPDGDPAHEFSVWWSSAKGEKVLHFFTPASGEVNLLLFDAGGRLVHRKILAVRSGRHTVSLGDLQLVTGLYICSAQFNGEGGKSSLRHFRLNMLPE